MLKDVCVHVCVRALAGVCVCLCVCACVCMCASVCVRMPVCVSPNMLFGNVTYQSDLKLRSCNTSRSESG